MKKNTKGLLKSFIILKDNKGPDIRPEKAGHWADWAGSKYIRKHQDMIISIKIISYLMKL